MNAQDLVGRSLAQASHEPDAGEGRRSAVLDATMSSLLDFGLRRTSMGEVARRAGVSEATLFRWYRSKGDLVTEAVAREVRVVIRDMETQTDPAAPAEVQVADALANLVLVLRVHPLLQRLRVSDPEAIVPASATGGSWVLEMGAERLGAWIAQRQQAGDLPRFDPGPPAEILARLVHSFAVTNSPSMPLNDPTILRDTLRAVASSALRPSEGGS